MPYALDNKNYDLSPKDFAATLANNNIKTFVFVGGRAANDNASYFKLLKTELDTLGINSIGFSKIEPKYSPIKDSLSFTKSDLIHNRKTTKDEVNRVEGETAPNTVIVCKGMDDLAKAAIAFKEPINPFTLDNVEIMEKEALKEADKQARFDKNNRRDGASRPLRPRNLPAEKTEEVRMAEAKALADVADIRNASQKIEKEYKQSKAPNASSADKTEEKTPNYWVNKAAKEGHGPKNNDGQQNWAERASAKTAPTGGRI